MQSPSSKKKRYYACASLAALALAGSLGIAACDSNSSSATAPDADKWIALTTPLGGETYKVGDSLRIKWTVKDNPAGNIEAVDVELSPDSGKTWGFLPWGPSKTTGSVKPTSPYWENFAWKITDTLYIASKDASIKLAGRQCLVRVKDYLSEAELNQSTTHTPITINP